MNTKKIFLILIGIAICIIVAVAIKSFSMKEEEQGTTEITPVEEMTEAQERQTIISLYFLNTETNSLVPEARVIDAKELLENPYKALLEGIIAEPKNEKLKSSIPKETKLNNVFLSGDCVTVDLSKEFVENQTEETIKLALYAIVNTLTELNEVVSVRILIDGEENVKPEGTEIELSTSFTRQDISI